MLDQYITGCTGRIHKYISSLVPNWTIRHGGSGGATLPVGSTAIEAPRYLAEQHNPRSIKEFLESTDNQITNSQEFEKLNELDQQYHVTQFDDDEAREYTGGTVEESMNR